jgi:quercetin dioxygenase-like cupin family protein
MKIRGVLGLFLPMGLIAASSANADPMQIVTPSAKLESCGPDAPGCQHLVLRGEPKTGPSQRVYHFPAKYVFEKHWHTSNQNLVITKGKFRIAADGQAEKILSVGDYLHIPADIPHWGDCPQECEFYIMEEGPTSFLVPEKN